MLRILIITLSLALPAVLNAKKIIVTNVNELHDADKNAKPGDEIILKNGEWRDARIKLSCSGTDKAAITFRAETAGKVVLTGNSYIKLGGNYLIVDGLYFKNGYAGKEPVISFRIDKESLANNSRVTNCVIESYNNPGRMDENTWVLFYGKKNRIDHCSFTDKQNMGVLLAVILDDERSRENFHSIDHNYFGKRLPLASNTGEIIRVGVSQHCQFNSNTQITDNFFEQCDGEAEVISIKSGSNVVKGNLIKESQGSIVLRHGDFNTVENNVIFGNYKEGTGGIRLVGKGQWVVNNFIFACRGIDFRSPLTVMNGIPNSPAHRYVQVTDAVIANNSFYNCSPISFCDGSDAERTLPPANIAFANNLFFNDQDSIFYRTFDDLSGFNFRGNSVNKNNNQQLLRGFSHAAITMQKNDNKPFPVSTPSTKTTVPDSIQKIAKKRLGHTISSNSGFSNLALIKQIQANAYHNTGATWMKQQNINGVAAPIAQVNCKNASDIYKAIDRNEPVYINMTGSEYHFDRPLKITSEITFTSIDEIKISTPEMHSLFEMGGNGNLVLQKVIINGEGVRAHNFITTDSTGPVNHFNLKINRSEIRNLMGSNGCKNFFHARKSIVADSIIISANKFQNNDVDYFEMNSEKADKGYYTAERIVIRENEFSNTTGVLLDIYRGGNDESTLGPNLTVIDNNFKDCKGSPDEPFINLVGVQRSKIMRNKFKDVNDGGVLVSYTDRVRAYHFLEENKMKASGSIKTNDFVINQNNKID